MAREVIPVLNQRLISPGSNDPEIIPIGLIFHVDAGNNPSLYDYFKWKSGGIESHLHIPKAGKPEQYRVFGHEADANYKANSFWRNGKRYGFVSVETQGWEMEEWNDHQLYWIKWLIDWFGNEWGMPLRVAPGPFSAGHGFHTMWGAPAAWTPVAKSCPGPNRKKQFNGIIAPWMNGAHDITTLPPEEIMENPNEVWQGKEVDIIPVARAQYSKKYREGNPTFTPRNALAQTWNLSAMAVNLGFQNRDALREIAKGMDSLGANVSTAVEKALAGADLPTATQVEELASDPAELARRVAPLLLEHQTELTEENIENAITTVIRRAVAEQE